MDGIITVNDIVIMQKYCVKTEQLSDSQYTAADFNNDGIVNVFDVLALRRFLINS